MKVKKTCRTAILPKRAYDSAGYDLILAGTAHIEPNSVRKVHTGIAVEIPPGHVGILKGRSSLESQGLSVVAGVIDQDYRGEVRVCLRNNTNEIKIIGPGAKMAQMLIVPVHTSDVEEVDELSYTERGEKGFGSTGA